MFWIWPPFWFCFKTPKTVEALAELTKGKPSRLGIWLFHRIWYKEDRERWGVPDYWQRPWQTLELRSGDCEDFAILAIVVMDIWKARGMWKNTPDPFILCVYKKAAVRWGKKEPAAGHAVCAWFDDKKKVWCHIGNWGFYRTGPLMEDLVNSIYDNWCVWQIRSPKGVILEQHAREEKG